MPQRKGRRGAARREAAIDAFADPATSTDRRGAIAGAGLTGRAAFRWALCCVWLLCWLPVLGLATSLGGEVYDVRTGRVVPDARVVLGGEAATSGADGSYKLIAAPRKPSDLVATAPGYAVTVIKYFPVTPIPDEIWRNVPLMPKASNAPQAGDFIEFFFGNAPLEEKYKGHVGARRFGKLPLRVGVDGVDDDGAAAVSGMLDDLNERWGLSILEVSLDEEPFVSLDFAGRAATPTFDYRDGLPTASFPGGATAENVGLAEGYLRRLVLNGDLEGFNVTAKRLRADESVAEDLDAVVEIIYRENADFNYGVFKRRPPARFAILTDLYLGVGGYKRHGVKDEAGGPVVFPGDYQLGQITVAGGGTYRNVWAKAGYWFSGIWEVDAEGLYPRGGVPAEKVLRRNSSTYYRGGYWLEPLGGVRLGPIGGYRTLSVRGKFKGLENTGGGTPLDIDYTTRYDGLEAGVGCDVRLKWFNLGFFGEYTAVFAEDYLNLAEVGFGAASRIGMGTFAFVRFSWGAPLNYTFGGLVMKLAIPL